MNLLKILPIAAQVFSAMQVVSNPNTKTELITLRPSAGGKDFTIDVSIIGKITGHPKLNAMDYLMMASAFYAAISMVESPKYKQQLIEFRPSYKGVNFSIDIALGHQSQVVT